MVLTCFTSGYEETKKNEKSHLMDQIRQLESQKKDKVRAYGDGIPAFIEALRKNQNKFTKPPIGPIGKIVYA
jgi:hypothetical protein